jgi:spore maturation protein CgeB
MRILYLASNKLQIAAVPFTLEEMGYEVGIYPRYLEDVETDEQMLEEFDRFVRDNGIDLVMSNTFYACAAEVTHRYGIKYAVYGMDSPHFMLWQKEARYDNVYLFQFDSHECEELKQNGYTNVWYMPLAARNKDDLVVTDADIAKYGCDVSFVGSLYTINVFDEIKETMPEGIVNQIIGWIGDSAFRWDGTDAISPLLEQETDPYWDQLYEMLRTFNGGKKLETSEPYLLRHWLIDRKFTNIERNMIMELLAERYDFRLYTREEEKVPPKIRRFGEVDSGTDSMRVFYSSKINLNLTLRSIEAGIPLRIFDIMSVGGFVLTDYREDAAGLFEEDKEIVMFRSPEEMLDKIDYYLTHEKERLRIGYNGYRKVKAECSYKAQLNKILKILK